MPKMLKKKILLSTGVDGHCNRSYTYFKNKLPKKLTNRIAYVKKYRDAKKYYMDDKGNVFNETEI